MCMVTQDTSRGTGSLGEEKFLLAVEVIKENNDLSLNGGVEPVRWSQA